MIAKVLQDWVYDWTGRAKVEYHTNSALSPFKILQQGIILVVLVFSEPLLQTISKTADANILLIIQLFLLCILAIMTNRIVVSKQCVQKDGKI